MSGVPEKQTWNAKVERKEITGTHVQVLAPKQAMKDLHKLKPELFRKQPHQLPGCDT